jgi:hypothetical protein
MVPSNFNIDPLETDYQAVARFVISNVEFSWSLSGASYLEQ